MVYEYFLKENDFFQLYLYMHTNDLNIKKKQSRYMFVYFVFWVTVSIIIFFIDEMFAGIILFAGLIGMFTIPYYLKKYYFQEYIKFVKNNFRDNFNKKNKLTFTDECIILYNDIKGNLKFTFDEIDEIIETGKYFYIHFDKGYVIVPKEGVENTDFKEQLDFKISIHNLRFISDLKWRW